MYAEPTPQNMTTDEFVGHQSSVASADARAHERTADLVLDDLFLSVGQAIGTRTTMEYSAVVWLRAHFRAKFLAALNRQGDRWLDDRAAVSAVAGLFAERAVRYAGDSDAIGVEHARLAAADVEKYCRMHARRAASKAGMSDADITRIAGYWCTEDPKP